MSCHSIAWECQRPKAEINRILYDLEKEKKVERVQLSPPIWKARNNISLSKKRNVIDMNENEQSKKKKIDGRTTSHKTTGYVLGHARDDSVAKTDRSTKG